MQFFVTCTLIPYNASYDNQCHRWHQHQTVIYVSDILDRFVVQDIETEQCSRSKQFAEESNDNQNLGIYLNYSINISSACMAKIKEYNDQQELNDLGFGDYTGGIENVKTREYRSQFLKDLEESSEYAVCREKPIINQLQK